MLLPSRTAARLAPLPRWARITRPFAGRRVAERFELFYQIGVGQTVEAIAFYTLGRYRRGMGSSLATLGIVR